MPRRRIELTKVDHLLDELLEDASTPEEILGEQGLLRQLTKRLMERALSAELTYHLDHQAEVLEDGDPLNATVATAIPKRPSKDSCLKIEGYRIFLLLVSMVSTGFPNAIATVFPQTKVQLCIVHLIRNALCYVSWKDRKAVAADLKPIYKASTVAEAEAALDAFLRNGIRSTLQF